MPAQYNTIISIVEMPFLIYANKIRKNFDCFLKAFQQLTQITEQNSNLLSAYLPIVRNEVLPMKLSYDRLYGNFVGLYHAYEGFEANCCCQYRFILG